MGIFHDIMQVVKLEQVRLQRDESMKSEYDLPLHHLQVLVQLKILNLLLL